MSIGFLNHSWKRYLILLPIVILVLNAFYFQFATDIIHETIFQEKFIETNNHINMLARAVEANEKRYWEDHQQNIVDSVEFLDSLPLTFAATYKPIDGTLEPISEIDRMTGFEPLLHDSFNEAVASQDSGKLTIGFTTESGVYREMHIYFTHMPMYAPPDERYLVVAAVCKQSVVTTIPEWVSSGQWISMIITFFINVWLIILIVKLGHINDHYYLEQHESVK